MFLSDTQNYKPTPHLHLIRSRRSDELLIIKITKLPYKNTIFHKYYSQHNSQ